MHKDKAFKKLYEKGRLLELCLFFSVNATSECLPPAAVLRVVCALWSAVLSFPPVLTGVKIHRVCRLGGCKQCMKNQEGNSLSADQTAELQPL